MVDFESVYHMKYPPCLAPERLPSFLNDIYGKSEEVLRLFFYVKQFRPEDISIKYVDTVLVIHAQHKEYLDLHGLVSRDFRWKYHIPRMYEPKSISANYGPYGILKVFFLKKNLWEELKSIRYNTIRGYIDIRFFNLKYFKCSRRQDLTNLEATVEPSVYTGERAAALRHTYYLPLDIVQKSIQTNITPGKIEIEGDCEVIEQSSELQSPTNPSNSPQKRQSESDIASDIASEFVASFYSAQESMHGSFTDVRGVSRPGVIIRNINYPARQVSGYCAGKQDDAVQSSNQQDRGDSSEQKGESGEVPHDIPCRISDVSTVICDLDLAAEVKAFFDPCSTK